MLKKSMDLREVESIIGITAEDVMSGLGIAGTDGKVLLTKEAVKTFLSSGTYMKKPSYNINVIEIKKVRNKNIYHGVVGVNRIIASRTIHDDNAKTVLFRNASGLSKKENFSFKYITIKLDEEASHNIAFDTFSGTAYVVYNKKTHWVEAYITRQGVIETYFNVKNGKEHDRIPCNDDCAVFKYKFDPATASSKRNLMGVFEDVTVEDTRFENFDNATCGALTIDHNNFMDDIKNIKTKEDKLKIEIKQGKSLGYLGNVSTGSVNFGVVENWTHYIGKFENVTQEYFNNDDVLDAVNEFLMTLNAPITHEKVEEAKEKILERLYNTKGHKASTQDGQGYINNVELSVQIYYTTGVLVDPVCLVGLLLQARPATVKNSMLVLRKRHYVKMVRGAKLLAQKNNVEFKEYGDSERSLFLVDNNSVKLDFDVNSQMTLEILAFNKISESHYSKQLLKNILSAALDVSPEMHDKACSMIKEIGDITIDNIFADTVNPDKKPKVLSPDEILNAVQSGYITNVVNQSNPNFKFEARPIYETVLGQTINAAVKTNDRMSFSSTMKSMRLISDATFILTGGAVSGILKFGELFINNKNVDEVVLGKYPIAGLKEHYPGKNVNVPEVINRTSKLRKNKKIERWMQDGIVGFFADLDSSVLCLPALMFIAMACAGLDFDYDGAVVIIKVKNPESREEEIANFFVDLLMSLGIRGVAIQTH